MFLAIKIKENSHRDLLRPVSVAGAAAFVFCASKFVDTGEHVCDRLFLAINRRNKRCFDADACDDADERKEKGSVRPYLIVVFDYVFLFFLVH